MAVSKGVGELLSSRWLAVRERLDALLAQGEHAARIHSDPVGLVHRFSSSDDREIAGLVASSLAFGNVLAIRRSVTRVLDVLGPAPATAIATVSEAELAHWLGSFVHRVYKGADIARMLARAAVLRARYGSLDLALREHLGVTHGHLRDALSRFADDLRGPHPSRSMASLLPDPRAGSACKRLLLYLRWMARPDDGIDLHVWPLDPSMLLLPLDTHVHRICRNLGLTARRDASWRTAEEVTAVLRLFDRRDPVKYDFAICHLGVSRRCPSRRDPVLCSACVLRTVCVQWAGRS